MVIQDPTVPAQVNWSTFDPASTRGHYESYYLRANHPDRPLAFWIRYTLFCPVGRPGEAIGELWAIVFDGESGAHASAKSELPMAECSFARHGFAVRVGAATLDAGTLRGSAGDIAWDLTYGGESAPLFLLPARLYRGGFPKAKSLVPRPLARFSGELRVDDRTIVVDDWRGSQNHNWGSRHTDHYAFGQVAGFDNAPDSFLEVATARNRIGPLWTPALTPLVLRHRGREHALNSVARSARAKATISATRWTFATVSDAVAVSGTVTAAPDAFVHLRYANPPGGFKHCHNTKLARCEVTVTDRATGSTEVLVSAHGGLFEILDDHPAQ